MKINPKWKKETKAKHRLLNKKPCQGCVHCYYRELYDLETVECEFCSTESRCYENDFEILIDKNTNKIYKKCKNCKKIDEIKVGISNKIKNTIKRQKTTESLDNRL